MLCILGFSQSLWPAPGVWDLHPAAGPAVQERVLFMASISREPNGHRTIQFVAVDGKRKSIRLGKVSQHAAESVKAKVEVLKRL